MLQSREWWLPFALLSTYDSGMLLIGEPEFAADVGSLRRVHDECQLTALSRIFEFNPNGYYQPLGLLNRHVYHIVSVDASMPLYN